MPARFLAVAEIGGPHGLEGEVALNILTEFPERLAGGVTFLLSPPLSDVSELTLVSVKGSGKVRARFEGIDTVEQARTLKGHKLVVHPDDAVPLDEGAFYIDDMLGLEVRDEGGEILGQLVEVVQTGANDVYVVELTAGRRLPLPAVKEVVLSVDLEAGRLTVRMLPGLEDLAY